MITTIRQLSKRSVEQLGILLAHAWPPLVRFARETARMLITAMGTLVTISAVILVLSLGALIEVMREQEQHGRKVQKANRIS
jgi:hypothetical protein